jgi:F-type H+-transporting ATPase subunit b
MADSIISDAKNKAKEEAGREVASAREAIELERKSAVAKLKAEVANLSIDIAEQIVRAELKEGSNQQELINKLIDESPLN